MSARNYLSARDKNLKHIDCLPNINQQKPKYRSGPELPPLSANTTSFVNRNLNYSFEPYLLNSFERPGTPFSDFFSESETGTPDFHSEESDSSSGSALQRSTDEATKILADEWEKIERTLYNENGEKSTRPQIIEECKQWRKLHPQLRIIGKAIQLPEKRLSCRQIEQDELIASHYSDYEGFSESEERLSQSSTDVTPQNSPRISVTNDFFEPKLSREKVSFHPMYNEEPELSGSFCSLLQITPIQIHSPAHRKKQNQPIVRSEIASSKWMRNPRPESSVNYDRNSAKSFVSLDTRNYGNTALSASERNALLNNRVVTARHRDVGRLEPIYTPEVQNDVLRLNNSTPQYYNIRKVSLPPLLLDEDKKKGPLNSARKRNSNPRQSVTKSLHQFDRVRYN